MRLAKKFLSPSNKHPAGPVSEFIGQRITAAARAEMEELLRDPEDPGREQQMWGVLERVLQAVVDGELIYDVQRFAGVRLSDAARRMLESEDTEGRMRAKLNRVLLHDAYPQEIAAPDEG